MLVERQKSKRLLESAIVTTYVLSLDTNEPTVAGTFAFQITPVGTHGLYGRATAILSLGEYPNGERQMDLTVRIPRWNLNLKDPIQLGLIIQTELLSADTDSVADFEPVEFTLESSH